MANWGKILSRGSVQDRRGFSPVVGGISITGFIILLVFNYLTGGSIWDMLGLLSNVQTPGQQMTDNAAFEGEDEYEVFASTVLGSNNDMWTMYFSEMGKTYMPPQLVLFRTATESGCGYANSQVGPHYCPYDQTIYLDETFFDELVQRFGAEGGDVAEAYVISHEVGHHIQNELDLISNRDSIAVELQADCFAGLWLHSIKDMDIYQPAEVHEAMDAAAAVGDDRIQERVTGQVSPENWTHGSSEQRVMAFNRGYEAGSFEACELQ